MEVIEKPIEHGEDDKTLTFSKAAKILGFVGFGRNHLFEFCRNNGYLEHNNEPFQRWVNAGYFTLELLESEGVNQTVPYTQTRITLKGLRKLKPLITEYLETLEKENESRDRPG